MFEKREKTPTSNARNGSQPSLETAMALQKMFEEGRFEQLDDAGENLASEPKSPRRSTTSNPCAPRTPPKAFRGVSVDFSEISRKSSA